jgi:15-cis-phytoene synthase
VTTLSERFARRDRVRRVRVEPPEGAAGSTADGYRHPAPSTELAAARGAGAGHVVDLAASYRICRRLAAAHGRTYFFATRFLSASQRPHVHALYAFARYADDLVDHLALDWSPVQRREALESWSHDFLSALNAGWSLDPVLAATIDTVRTLGIDRGDLEWFLRSMAMDLTVTRYDTFEDLYEYVYGSAAVIGSMMLPILGARHPDARSRAMDLGVAFQLTNFLRDVAEDWDRGRIYLPLEDLERFGVTEADFRSRQVGQPMRRLLAFEAARTRSLYQRAEQGWAMIEPRSRRCIRIAHRLYGEILDRLEAQDWQVFDRRASVPTRRKVAVALREYLVPTRPCPPTGGTRQ